MRIVVLILFSIFIYASNLEYYLFSIKMDYSEIYNGYVIDKDKTNFGDLNGIDIEYRDRYFIPYFLRGEFAYGKSEYIGQTQDGTSVNTINNNVYIFNIECGAFIFNNPFYLSFGYRLWNRGKSNYEGDYNEQYYWKYVGFGYLYNVYFRNFLIRSDLEYQLAINPKIDVLLGSGTTLNLGETTGLKYKLNFDYFYSNNIMLSFMYKIQLWHINVSETGSIILDNDEIEIFEPESYTINQYIGVGVVYKF